MRSSFGLLFLAVLLLAALGGAGYFLFSARTVTETAQPEPTLARPDASTSEGPVAALPEIPDEPSSAADPTPEAAPQEERVAVSQSEHTRLGDWEGPSTILSGRVALPAGVPIDDELVVLGLSKELSANRVYEGRAPVREMVATLTLEHEHDDAILSEAKVGADGIFEIEFPEDQRSGWLAISGRYLYSPQFTQVELPSTESVELIPGIGAYVTGRITLPGGLADAASVMEDIDVELGLDTSEFSLMNQDTTWFFSRNGKVESDGRFEIRAVVPERKYKLEVESETLANHFVDEVQLEPGKERHFEVSLLRGARILGRVVDENGEPIAQAEVKAERPGFMGMGGDDLAETESEEDGSFELLGVTPGSSILVAEVEGRIESKPLTLDLLDGEVREDVEVTLENGNHIAGTVRYADGRPGADLDVRISFDPAAMAGLTAFNASRGASGKARTDDQGNFHVQGLGNGPFVAKVDTDGHDGAQIWSAAKDGIAPNSDDVQLVLEPRPSFRGRVIDLDGSPIVSFRVHSRSATSTVWIPVDTRVEGFDDPLGEFTVTNLSTGSWEFHVSADGYGDSLAVSTQLPLDPGAELTTFILKPAAAVAGLVVDSQGNPVPNAKVTISVGTQGMAVLSGSIEVPETHADEEGAYLLEGLAEGTVSVVAQHAEFADSEPLPTVVFAGETTPDVTLTLRVGGVITGEVFGKDGEPAGGAQLIVQDTATWGTMMSRTEPDGTFRLERLRPGNWQVTAMLGSMTPEVSDNEAPDMSAFMENMRFTVTEVKDGEVTHIVLGAPPEDPVRVHGRVTHSGKPVSGSMVSFLPEGDAGFQSMKFTQLDEDGAYELELAKPGPYLVQVQRQEAGSSFSQNSLEFPRTIPAGEEHRLDLKLPVGRISGRIMGRDSNPLDGTRVTLTTDGGVTFGTFMGGQYGEATTDDDGNYSFEYLRPGTYSVAAGGALFGGALGGQAEHGREVRSGIEVGEGEDKDGIDFRLERAGAVTGTILDTSGKPLGGASVFVRDGAGRLLDRFSMIQSGPDGRFEYNGIASGRYTIQARTRELVSAQEVEIDVREGDTVDTTLTLGAGTIVLVSIQDKSGNDVRARVSVTDSRGREVNGLVSLSEIMGTGSNFSSTVQRVGPVPPDSYIVRAVTEDGREVKKPVNLKGQAERKIKLRLR